MSDVVDDGLVEDLMCRVEAAEARMRELEKSLAECERLRSEEAQVWFDQADRHVEEMQLVRSDAERKSTARVAALAAEVEAMRAVCEAAERVVARWNRQRRAGLDLACPDARSLIHAVDVKAWKEGK